MIINSKNFTMSDTKSATIAGRMISKLKHTGDFYQKMSVLITTQSDWISRAALIRIGTDIPMYTGYCIAMNTSQLCTGAILTRAIGITIGPTAANIIMNIDGIDGDGERFF